MAQNAYQTELTNPPVVSGGSAVDPTGFAIRRLSPLPIDFATPAIDCGNAQKARVWPGTSHCIFAAAFFRIDENITPRAD